ARHVDLLVPGRAARDDDVERQVAAGTSVGSRLVGDLLRFGEPFVREKFVCHSLLLPYPFGLTGSLKPDGERLQTAQDEVLLVFRLAREDLVARDLLGERPDGDRALEPREGRADAEVDPRAEGHMVRGLRTRDVERLGRR